MSILPTPPEPKNEPPAVPEASLTAMDTDTEIVGRPNDLRFLLPDLLQMFQTGRLSELIMACEQADLTNTHDRDPTRLLITAPLVLAYLIVHDLPPARWALIRLPHSIANLELSRALFNLLTATWKRQYPIIYSRVQELLSLCTSPAMDVELGLVLKDMIDGPTGFLATSRMRTLKLLSRTYPDMPKSLAETYLGLPAEQITLVTSSKGWSSADSSSILQANASAPPHIHGRASGLHTFDNVTNAAAMLESLV